MNTVYGLPDDHLKTIEVAELHCPNCGREIRFCVPEKLSDWNERGRYYKGVIGELHQKVTDLQRLLGITSTPKPKTMLKDMPCCG